MLWTKLNHVSKRSPRRPPPPQYLSYTSWCPNHWAVQQRQFFLLIFCRLSQNTDVVLQHQGITFISWEFAGYPSKVNDLLKSYRRDWRCSDSKTRNPFPMTGTDYRSTIIPATVPTFKPSRKQCKWDRNPVSNPAFNRALYKGAW